MQISPLVSVIIPVYNVEFYLEKCLNSVVNQTYSNLEIIIINDESPDNSYVIIERFLQSDKRIKSFNQKNSGVSAARNTGIENSSGEFIMFVDSDDWVESNIIEKLLVHIHDHELSICSYNRCYDEVTNPRKLNLEGRIDGKRYQRRIIGLTANELNDPSQADSIVSPCGKLYLSKIIHQYELKFISTQEIGTAEDLIFNLQYAEFVNNVFVIDEPLYNYIRNNVNSYTSHYKHDLFTKWNVLFSKIKTFTINKDQSFIEAYRNRICLSIIGLGLNELSNPSGINQITKNLKYYLSNAEYVNAYKHLKLREFPLHWKLFFFCAKYKHIFPLFYLLKIISKIVNKNK